MSESFLMGLDLGGGGLRCLVVGTDTGRASTAYRAWASQPATGVPMGMEYDADATWRALAAVAREALARAGADGAQVAGLAATSMRHGSVLLDGAGRELLVAPNRDARGAPNALRLAAERGRELHRRTGHWPYPVQPAGRLRWLVTEASDTLARAATHLALSDWIAFRLCGERATDASQASETLLLEIAEREWAWDLIDALEIPRAIFPELRDAGSPLGPLSQPAADALGLRPGIPVAMGGADTQCGLLGAGVVAPGQLGAVVGTSAPVLQVADRAILDADARLWAVHHVVPGRWALESNGGGLGEALDWIAGVLFPDRDHPVLHLLAEASTAPPGSAGLLSTFGAQVMDARVTHLPVGNLALNHLTSADDPARRRHVARSVLEGMACALRANTEQVEAATHCRADGLRITGGVSRSAFFTQLVADVTGRPVEVTAVSEASALGAAICAGVGAGVFGDLADGARALVQVARSHVPDPVSAEVYARLYPGWCEVREASLESEERASRFAIGALASSVGPEAAVADDFRPRILVTADLDDAALAALREIGDVEHQSYRTAMRLLTGSSLAEALQGVHVFVTEVDVVDAPALLRARDLRVIGVCRGDAVNVDLEACTALGIPVFNTPGRNADAVADLTLAYLLMLARKLQIANAFLREPGGEAGDMGRMGRAFGSLRGRELWRQTVGLVGLGAVGRKVLKRLRPFGARCLVYDPYQEPDAVRLAGGEPVSLDTLLAESDFVSLHAAVTEQSRGLLGAEQLARMKPGACLVNSARAALVDEDAVLEALRSGHLAGAALDVFAVEPPGSDHPLLSLENVIATPHVGGNTEQIAAHQGQTVAEELARLQRGKRPRHPLNPDALEGYHWSRPRPVPPAELAAKLGKTAGPAVTDLQKQKPAGAPRAPAPRAERPAAASRGGSTMPEIQETMERILRVFIERFVADATLGERAQDVADVTLHFTVTDLGSEFHIGFRDAQLIGGLGAPQDDANRVQLKLRADLLDGMLTGRRNAMQAAMDGELAFSGDTAKAMTLQQINADMSRLYRKARDEVGDPGDLRSLPDPSAQGAPATLAQPGASIAPDDVRVELCRVVEELYNAQLITATGGNVSARIPDAADEAWITPSQLFKGDLSPEILVRIGMDGRVLDDGARSPSSEALMHAAVFRARPEARAVIHCHAPNATVLVNADLPFLHAPNATVLVNADLPFLPVSTEAAFFQNIGRIPFIMPGTHELADAIVEALGDDGWAVLMRNHGLLVAGRSLRRAADMVEIIERSAQVILGCHAVGKEPPVLPEEVVQMLARYGDLMA
jgi:autoinducer 2 (AI-2) kinase